MYGHGAMPCCGLRGVQRRAAGVAGAVAEAKGCTAGAGQEAQLCVKRVEAHRIQLRAVGGRGLARGVEASWSFWVWGRA